MTTMTTDEAKRLLSDYAVQVLHVRHIEDEMERWRKSTKGGAEGKLLVATEAWHREVAKLKALHARIVAIMARP